MTSAEESFNRSKPNSQRWYDQDPALSGALSQLRGAPDKYQAQVALNIIKIIIEHQIEEDAQAPIDFRSNGQAKSALAEAKNLVNLKNFLKNLFPGTPQENGHRLSRSLNDWLHQDSPGSEQDQGTRKRRWYDAHEALESAMQLLYDCPDDLQHQVIPTVATMIETTLQNPPVES